MPSGLIRRIVVAAAALALAVIAALAALPYVAATQLVRDRIALELGMWSGYRVTLGAAPEIDVWPVFQARLADVTFAGWTGDAQPALHADGIDAGLSAFAALRGDVVFTQVKLVRPTVHLRREKLRGVPEPRNGEGGRFGRAVAVARALVQANQAQPDVSALPSDSIGIIEVVDGRVAVQGDGAETEILSSVSGTLDWPAFDRGASLRASGIWRGEMVTLEGSVDLPLILAAGGTSSVLLKMQSAPFATSFKGTANLSGETYFSGGLEFASPSMRRVLEWSKLDIAPGSAVGAISLKGQVSGAARRLKLADATLSVDANKGTGTVEMALWDPVPAISGTLAFDKIDLRSFLSAFSALTPDLSGSYRTVDSRVGDQIALDLRLSAKSANAGGIVLTDVAATAQVKSGLAAFDISDAVGFDGDVQAGLRVDRHSGHTAVELRLRGSNVDIGALAETTGIHRLVPISRADFSIALKGQGEDMASVLRSADGSISASFGRGAMAGIDLPRFSERAKSGEFFPLAEVGAGALAFKGFELRASVKDGVARIEKAEIETADDGTLSLRGIVPLPGRGLALAGNLVAGGPQGDAAGSKTPISFFIGGSWEAPYISPVLPGDTDR